MVVERASQRIPKETIDEDYSELPLDDILNYIDQHLTPQTRTVMLKRYGENRKYNEISEELGISRIAVYKHITQALTKLKKQFVWKS
jgi:RNA polymerase sigma factor (sigma-70 family)